MKALTTQQLTDLKKYITDLHDNGFIKSETKDDICGIIEAKLDVDKVFPFPSCEINNEWVSVKDRLPEPNKEVLVCLTYDSGRQEIVFSYTTTRFPDLFDHLLHSIITHWMPLPSPPNK